MSGLPEITSLSDADLVTEYNRVRDRGAELSALETPSPDEVTELGELASRLTELQTERSARADAAAALQAHRDAFAAAPVAEPAPVPEPAPVAEPAPVPEVQPETVTAAAPPAPVVPSVAVLPPAEVPVPVADRRGTISVRLTADGAGALGKQYGDESDMSEVTRAVLASFKTYGHSGGASSKRAIAQITHNRSEGLEFTRNEKDDYETVQKLIKQDRLPGGSLLQSWQAGFKQTGSLTAAAGWCAPSEIDYSICSLWSSDGMLDLPTASARRGGWTYFSNPVTFADLDASTSFTVLTEAQVIADTPKQCAELPCPTPTEMRLDVAVTCITGSFLQSHGYPEWVETWVDGLQVNHAHKLNELLISRIVTRAGAPVVIPGQGGTPGAGSAIDTSAIASVLSAVDLAATDMRYRERMARNATFEVVLPLWVLTQFRADQIRKNGWNPANATLADQTLVSWFADRNIRPQFVYDWQDFYSGVAGGPGAAAPMTALPATVNFLIYPAGAVVLAREDVVTLSNVYDAANLQQNLFTRLFSEEGFGLLFPCGQIRQYTAQVCPSGATGYQAYTACVAAAPAA